MPVSACDRAVLLTAVYADLFDFPLTMEEVFTRLVGCGFDRLAVSRSLASLTPSHLSTRDGFVFLRGRHHLVDVRLERMRRASASWAAGRRYARWLSLVPFVRMVAVSGSLAVNNANRASDVDLFCVTAARRLWIARLFIVPLSKLTRKLPRLFSRYLCPNYVVSLDALEVEDRNLFTAHEVLQAVPLFGTDVCETFLQRNAWVHDVLPNLRSPSHASIRWPQAPFRMKAMVEHVLGGRLGDRLNRLAYRSFVGFYRRRALRNGWNWNRIVSAYQIESYTVPEGGYTSVVADLFRKRVLEVAGGVVAPAELDALFPPGGCRPATQYDWEGMFRTEYGVGLRGAA